MGKYYQILHFFAKFGNLLKMKDSDNLFTINECCELLEISRPTFDRLRKTHSLTEYKVGKRVRFNKEELLQLLGQKKENTLGDIEALVVNSFQLDQAWPSSSSLNIDALKIIDCFGAAALLCQCLERSKNYHIAIDSSPLALQASYLKAINFFPHFTRHAVKSPTISSSIMGSLSRSFPEIILPISQAGSKGVERRYTEDLRPILREQGFSDDIGHYIAWSLGELADNAHTHAQTKGQCFISVERVQGHHNFLIVTIVDNGIGIPASLKSNKKYAHLSDEEALLWAFRPYVSSWDDEHKRGKGLTDILKIAFECSSFFRVESGNAALLMKFKDGISLIERIPPSSSATGTRISLILVDNQFKEANRQDIDNLIKSYLKELNYENN
jgi:excisionase family DNA binding protein